MQVLREISVKKRRHEISQHPNSGTSFLPRHSLSLCSPHEQVDHACCLLIHSGVPAARRVCPPREQQGAYIVFNRNLQGSIS